MPRCSLRCWVHDEEVELRVRVCVCVCVRCVCVFFFVWACAGVWESGVAVERVISVRPTDVLGTAMNMLMATRMHRVWVVDRKSGQPSGLISIADVLAVLSSRLFPEGAPSPAARADVEPSSGSA